MSKVSQRHIEVFAHWLGLPQPLLMGVLSATASRGKEIFSFCYDKAWLKSKLAPSLDPTLQLFAGPQYAPPSQKNFGIFLDSSPDRWGRFLMNRREAQRAKEEGRTPRKLVESDYLLGVYDEHRMGALRFRLNAEGPFLDHDQQRRFHATMKRYIALQNAKGCLPNSKIRR